jgi:hypothetical protein
METRKRPPVVLVAAIGSLLLGFCCCGQGSMTAAMPLFFDWHKGLMKSVMGPPREKLVAERKTLENERAATTDRQEIAAIDQQIATIDRQMPPDIESFYAAIASPAATRCYLFEGFSGLIANLLIFIAGIGLLAMKPWARTLALYAAIARIITALIYAVLAVTVVMPAMAAGMRKFQESMSAMSQGAGQSPLPDMGPMMALQGTVGALFGVLMAIAWPVALLIMLNTKSAKEALAPGAAAQDQEQGEGFQPGPG